MWRVTIKGLLADKLRLALTALAIVIGVTFIAGTLVLTDTLHSTFNTLFSNIYQNIDFQVRGVAQFGSGGTATRNPVPESVLSTVRGVPGVEAADGSVAGYAQYVAPDGKAITTGGAPTLGISFDPNPQLSQLRLSQGTAPTSSNDVVMDLGTAEKYHFTVGEHVRILLEGPTKTFTITGLARFGTANNLAGATLAAFDTPTAQRLLGEVGKFDTVNVVTKPGTDSATVQRAIAARAAPWRGGGDRSDRHQRGDERRQPGARLPQHGVARVRIHCTLRGLVHHRQHVLHHCGAAHARAGACCALWAPAAARCSARCSSRRRSSDWCRLSSVSAWGSWPRSVSKRC